MKEAPTVKEINPAAKCEQHCIPVNDTETDDLLSWFQEAIDFIQKGLASDGKVLVHCIQGVSRSSTAGFSPQTTCELLAIFILQGIVMYHQW